MAYVTKDNSGKTMADDDRDDEADEREERDEAKPLDYRPKGAPQPAGKSAAGHGFFHIYKSGQGYWTRMGSAAGALLLILLICHFFWDQVRPRFDYLIAREHMKISLAIVAALFIGLSLLTWWIMNIASNVDFLIATDSEMKKVNWTSKKELIGSTKVVIVFMLVIAGFLFVVDLVFHYLFFFMGVLKAPPPFWPGH
jgi:preprotein translocase subunit SecE